MSKHFSSIFIEQRISDKLYSKIELGETDTKTIEKFVNVLAGNIIVYNIDKTTNKKEDLTSEYGRRNFIRDSKKQLYRGNYTAVCDGGRKYPFYKIYLEGLTSDDFFLYYFMEKLADILLRMLI